MNEDKVETTAVLIISYDYVLRDILTKMLISKGHKVVNRSVGFHGIRTFEKAKGNFDIVLMDSKLPDMNWPTVVRAIRQVSNTTPIFLFKERKERVDNEQAQNAGVDLTIPIPIYMDNTYERIKNALDNRAGS
ncbi:MAG: response regulator [Thermodesulfobacteriota bacterium]